MINIKAIMKNKSFIYVLWGPCGECLTSLFTLVNITIIQYNYTLLYSLIYIYIYIYIYMCILGHVSYIIIIYIYLQFNLLTLIIF